MSPDLLPTLVKLALPCLAITAVLGTARLKSRSLLVPIVMHALGNLISIGQSLAGGS